MNPSRFELQFINFVQLNLLIYNLLLHLFISLPVTGNYKLRWRSKKLFPSSSVKLVCREFHTGRYQHMCLFRINEEIFSLTITYDEKTKQLI